MRRNEISLLRTEIEAILGDLEHIIHSLWFRMAQGLAATYGHVGCDGGWAKPVSRGKALRSSPWTTCSVRRKGCIGRCWGPAGLSLRASRLRT